jgi:pSer/pThr/pTyr-binding forkhead associated (FHA) protein
MDLQSTHGTYVNRQRILPSEYVCLEEGAIVEFGESSRFYTVSTFVESSESEEEGVNWGMDWKADEAIR